MKALQARITAPIPIALNSRAGTIANELRACLDGLACVLAIRNSEPAKDVYFPISKDAAIFGTDGMKKIKKLLPEDQKKIIDLKPYKGGDPDLFALHEADRIRNTERLIGTSGASGHGLRNGYVDISIGQTVAALTENWATLKIVGPRTAADINVYFDIVYAEPPGLTGKRVVAVLENFADRVTDIIGMFD